MADFKPALAKTLTQEGGWADLDGGTYRGIVRKTHPDWGGWSIIDRYIRKIGRNLRWNEVIKDVHLDAMVASFYRVNFWGEIRGDEIKCQRVAENLFDWTVTSWNDATKALQKIVNTTPDGVFGPKTLKAVNDAGCTISDEFRNARIKFYKELNGKYSSSWIERAEKF